MDIPDFVVKLLVVIGLFESIISLNAMFGKPNNYVNKIYKLTLEKEIAKLEKRKR